MLYWKHLLTNNFSSVYVLKQPTLISQTSGTHRNIASILEPICSCFIYWYQIHFITNTCRTLLTRIVITQQIQGIPKARITYPESVFMMTFKPFSSQLHFNLDNRLLMFTDFCLIVLILITTRGNLKIHEVNFIK